MKNEDQKEPGAWCCGKKSAGAGTHAGNAVYGLGVVGALVYYFQHVTTFPEGIMGVVKSILWPAIFVYKALDVLNF